MTGIIATNASENSGAIVWWSLKGLLDLDKLREAWVSKGLDEAMLPIPPSPKVALHRAVHSLRGRNVVTTLNKGEGRGGYAITEVAEEGDADRVDDLKFSTWLKVYLNKVGTLSFTFNTDREEPTHTIEGISGAYKSALCSIDTADASNWLCKIAELCDAVTLKVTGGLYFIPRHRLDKWEAVLECVRAASAHSLASIPAIPCDEVVGAVLSGIEAEMDATVAEMDKALETDDLGTRALKSRIGTVQLTEQKLSRYETLLEVKLDSLRSKLQGMQASLTVAIVKAEADQDAAASV